MLHGGSVPILLVKGDFKAWPSRIRGQIIPTLFTQQPWVLPFISSRCFSIPSKMNFISLSQTSIKCPPCSIHCRVPCSFELWFEYLASFCQPCSPCHSCVAAKHFYLLPTYCNLKPHFFLLNKYLFCSGSWAVLCWLSDQWQLHHETPLPFLSGLWINGKLLWLPLTRPLSLGVCAQQPHPGDSAQTLHTDCSAQLAASLTPAFAGVTGCL